MPIADRLAEAEEALNSAREADKKRNRWIAAYTASRASRQVASHGVSADEWGERLSRHLSDLAEVDKASAVPDQFFLSGKVRAPYARLKALAAEWALRDRTDERQRYAIDVGEFFLATLKTPGRPLAAELQGVMAASDSFRGYFNDVFCSLLDQAAFEEDATPSRRIVERLGEAPGSSPAARKLPVADDLPTHMGLCFPPGEVRLGERSVELVGKPRELVILLAQAGGRAILRSDIIAALWQDRGDSVEDSAADMAVSHVRKALRKLLNRPTSWNPIKAVDRSRNLAWKLSLAEKI